MTKVRLIKKGEIKMKTLVLYLNLLFLSISNLLAQEFNNDSVLKIDSGYINVEGGSCSIKSLAKVNLLFYCTMVP